jgi:hypothetical protein
MQNGRKLNRGEIINMVNEVQTEIENKDTNDEGKLFLRSKLESSHYEVIGRILWWFCLKMKENTPFKMINLMDDSKISWATYGLYKKKLIRFGLIKQIPETQGYFVIKEKFKNFLCDNWEVISAIKQGEYSKEKYQDLINKQKNAQPN